MSNISQYTEKQMSRLVTGKDVFKKLYISEGKAIVNMLFRKMWKTKKTQIKLIEMKIYTIRNVKYKKVKCKIH